MSILYRKANERLANGIQVIQVFINDVNDVSEKFKSGTNRKDNFAIKGNKK